MKLILTAFFITCLNIQVYCNTANNCDSALLIRPDSSCIFQNYICNDTSMWFKFIAESNSINITVITKPYTDNVPHIHKISLYDGSCSVKKLIVKEILPKSRIGDTLAINLNSGTLIIGEAYLIRIDRKPEDNVCASDSCTLNNFSNTACFKLCVQSIFATNPSKYEIEDPLFNHQYIENLGQLIDTSGNPISDVKFYTFNSNPIIYIYDDKTSMLFSKSSGDIITQDTVQQVVLSFKDDKSPYSVFKAEKAPKEYSFFLPYLGDSLTGIKSYYMILNYNVYADIDVVYYSNSEGFKIYLLIKPGANLEDVKMLFKGADTVITENDGGITLITKYGAMNFDAAHAWQFSDDSILLPLERDFKFYMNQDNDVQLNITAYDKSQLLILQIDQGHAPGSTINKQPDFELKNDDSDDFEEPTLNVHKWTDAECYRKDDFAYYKCHLVPQDQDPLDANSNLNIKHGTAIIDNKIEKILRLDLKREDETAIWVPWQTLWKQFQYTSSNLASVNLYKYGLFEIKAKFAEGNLGINHAIWLWGLYNNTNSEIDIIETDDNDPNANIMIMSLHNGPQNCYFMYNNLEKRTHLISSDPKLNYHTYGVDWQPSFVKYFLDGKLVNTYYTLRRDKDDDECENNSFITGESYIGVQKLNVMHLVINAYLNSNINPNIHYPLPGEHYYTDIDYVKIYKIKPSIIGPQSVCYGQNYTFSAFQYYGYVTSDNYTWEINGGIRTSGINGTHNESIDVQITDQNIFSITAIAHEPSWNDPSVIPWLVPSERISSTTKTYLVGSQPSPPFIINIERWGNSCSYRAYVKKAKNVDQYLWKVDNSSWENGINSGSQFNEVNYCDVRDLLPNRIYTIKVQAFNCAGNSSIITQTIHTPEPPEDCTWRLGGDNLDSNQTRKLLIKHEDNEPIIYFSPATNQFVMKLNQEDNVVLYVYDVCGKVVLKKIILSTSESEIRFGESLRYGIYFYQLYYSNKTFAGKLIKCK